MIADVKCRLDKTWVKKIHPLRQHAERDAKNTVTFPISSQEEKEERRGTLHPMDLKIFEFKYVCDYVLYITYTILYVMYIIYIHTEKEF